MKRVILFFAVLIFAAGAWKGWKLYSEIWGGATRFYEESKVVCIPSTFSFHEMMRVLLNEGVIKDSLAFEQTATLKKFETVKPGRYRFSRGMSNNDIVNMLRIGNQEPVRLLVKSARLPAEMAGIIASQLELDSLELSQAMSSGELATQYGFTKDNFRTMFLPNTYEMKWNISTAEFVQRMAKEYKVFWNEERLAKARSKGLSQSECTTLASIVKAETAKRDEAPLVAGLYLNRIKKGIPLQADPTLIYAAGDFSIKRVLDKHKEINSPYNTYKNAGLPPGPINFPETNYIDAVLNAASHEYIYMCAKPDFSGYHNFAKSYNQHLQNARKYQQALNSQGVYR